MTTVTLPRVQTHPVLATWRPWLRWLYWLPLALILVAQALLSMRLIGRTYASGDEGRYIYAGHQLIYEFWHGGGSPYFETSFAGAPVIYPLLAAMVDHISGLAGVRLMSLAFMMTATATLFVTTRRLFGYLPGLLAAGLFAGLGLTHGLGALATCDAMAVMLMAMSTYCAVRTGDDEPHATRWLLSVPVALVVANSAKYMTIICDPPVIAFAALQVSSSGLKRVTQRVIALGLATAALLVLAAFLAGGGYVAGIVFSALAWAGRNPAVFAATKVPGGVILADTWQWMGAVIAISAVSLAIAWFARRDLRLTLLIALAIVAGLMVTAEGMHLHNVESMRRHDGYAAWFACMAAGSVLSHFRAQGRNLAVAALAPVCLATAAGLSGMHYSKLGAAALEGQGSKARLLVASELRPYLELRGGRFLLGGPDGAQLLYIDAAGVPWYRYNDDLYIKYPIPGRGGDSHGQAHGQACFTPRPGCMYLEGIAAYRAAIRAHWFSLVSMYGAQGSRQDLAIEQAVERTRGYVLLTTVGGAPTWIYAPAYRHHSAAHQVLPAIDPSHSGAARTFTSNSHAIRMMP